MNSVLLADSLRKSVYYSNYKFTEIKKKNLFIVDKNVSLEIYNKNSTNNKLYLIVNSEINMKNNDYNGRIIIYVHNPENHKTYFGKNIVKNIDTNIKLRSYSTPFRDHNDYLRYIISNYKNSVYNEGNFANSLWNISSHLFTHISSKMLVYIDKERIKDFPHKYTSFLNPIITYMGNLNQYNFIQIFLTLFADYDKYIHWVGGEDTGFAAMLKYTSLNLDEDLLFLLIK